MERSGRYSKNKYHQDKAKNEILHVVIFFKCLCCSKESKVMVFNQSINLCKVCSYIVNNKINPRFIPNIKEEDGNFKLLLLFDFKK